MEYRIERDSMGEMQVPADRYWAAQTQRSYQNFKIGIEKMPTEIVHAFGILKKGAAIANFNLGKLDEERKNVICQAADDVISGKLMDHFPLAVWQTGSGTQSNMNSNEVIANRGNEIAGKKLLHPNDHINMSQSSNDTFPTALHIAAAMSIEDNLFPAMDKLTETLKRLESENEDVVKSGRTHLQDAVPIRFSQEISGWRNMLEKTKKMLEASLPGLKELALGGTAVGTGLNAPKNFGPEVAKVISELTGKEFVTAEHKFHALTAKDDITFAHGALKALAADLMKIANDVRWLASGPRCGLGEISIPENEPGSSIMPGKVNPVIPEVVNQVAFNAIGNDMTITMAAEAGQLELNAFEPIIFYCLFQSIDTIAYAVNTFVDNCVIGITANETRCRYFVENSVGIITAICTYVGYQKAAEIAKEAIKTGESVRKLIIEKGLLTKEQMDEIMDPVQMTEPGISGKTVNKI